MLVWLKVGMNLRHKGETSVVIKYAYESPTYNEET